MYLVILLFVILFIQLFIDTLIHCLQNAEALIYVQETTAAVPNTFSMLALTVRCHAGQASQVVGFANKHLPRPVDSARSAALCSV